MLDKIISIFPTVKNIGKPFNRQIQFCLINRIRDGKHLSLDLIKNIRQMVKDGAADDEIKAQKLKLPNYTFSGTFTVRKYEDGNQDNLTNYTGIVLLDFDDFTTEQQVLETKAKICKDDFTAACFISVSGLGLKVLVQTDNTDHKQHKLYVEEVINYYSKYGGIDEAGSKIAQGTYDSYDPDLYFNPAYNIWTVKAEQQNFHFKGSREFSEKCPFSLTISDEYTLFQEAVQFRNKYDSFMAGNRNNYIHQLGKACAKLGIEESYAKQMAGVHFTETGFGQAEIDGAIESGYKRKRHEFGSVKLRDKTKYNIIRQLLKEDKPKDQIVSFIQKEAKEENVKIKKQDIEQAIEEVINEEQSVYMTFWDTFQKDPDKPESPFVIKFNFDKWSNWLSRNGVYLYYPAGDRSGDYMFIKVQNNIVKPLEKSYFPKAISDHINKLPSVVDNVSRSALLNEIARYVDSLVTKTKLEMLVNEIPLNFIQDTKDKAHFYFKDSVVEVTKDAINILGYLDINGSCVWDRKRIQRSLVDMDTGQKTLSDYLTMGKDKFAFGDWINEICDGDLEVSQNLCAVLGYLMHGFKDASNPRAVVFLETPRAGNPEGGTGKGILVQAIQQVKSVIRENGKIANPKDKFWAQSISLDTDIFCIEDVQRNFEFEDIFSVITDGITVEGKYRTKYYIPYEKSPKIVITTNYPLRGSGSSHERRKYEIELSHRFKDKYGDPVKYYGKRFFSADWDESEWQHFYYFMFHCVKYYLSLEGELTIIPSLPLSIKQLGLSTAAEFPAFAVENIEIDRFYSKRDIRDQYAQYYEAVTKKPTGISVQKVTGYCKEYARYLGCVYDDEKKHDNKQGFILRPAQGGRMTPELMLIALKEDTGLELSDSEMDSLSNEMGVQKQMPKTKSGGLPF